MRTLFVNFGPMHSGRASEVSYQILASDGSVLVPETSDGVVEKVAASGLYAASVAAASTWGVVEVVWRLASANLAAAYSFDTKEPYVASWWAGPPLGGFSYEPSLIGTVPLHFIRARLGDTDASTALLGDAEINALVAAGGVRQAAIQAALNCSAVLGRRSISSANEQTRVQYQDRAAVFRDIADRLRTEQISPALEPVASNGLSVFAPILVPSIGGRLGE